MKFLGPQLLELLSKVVGVDASNVSKSVPVHSSRCWQPS